VLDTALFAVSQINDVVNSLLTVEQNDAAAEDYALPLARQARQSNFTRFRQRSNALLQSRRQGTVALKLPFQSRRQSVFLSQSRRQTGVIIGDATAQNLAIMRRENVIVVVSALTPMIAVVIIIVVISIVSVMPRASTCIAIIFIMRGAIVTIAVVGRPIVCDHASRQRSGDHPGEHGLGLNHSFVLSRRGCDGRARARAYSGADGGAFASADQSSDDGACGGAATNFRDVALLMRTAFNY
jgi:hypothetical protein